MLNHCDDHGMEEYYLCTKTAEFVFVANKDCGRAALLEVPPAPRSTSHGTRCINTMGSW
jgi:hypothetical protein